VERPPQALGDGGPQPGASELLLALRDLQVAMDRGAAGVAHRAGLSPADMAALDVVMSAAPDEAVGPGDIARHHGITTASATVMVDRLVSSGHVERHPHPTDRRRVVLRHTGSAEATVWEVLLPLLGDLAELESRLDERDLEVVLRFVRAATEVYGRHARGDDGG
jgi:DNA-binding MarR family transcriptional regulator